MAHPSNLQFPPPIIDRLSAATIESSSFKPKFPDTDPLRKRLERLQAEQDKARTSAGVWKMVQHSTCSRVFVIMPEKISHCNMSICLSVDLSIRPSIYQPIYVSICLSIYLSSYPSICLSIDRIYLSVCMTYTHTQCTHRHMHAYTRRYLDTYTRTHRHTDAQTHKYKDTHIHVHRHTDTQTHRHTDTQTHGHTDTRTHGHTDTRTHGHTDTQIQRYTHTRVHIHTDTHHRV